MLTDKNAILSLSASSYTLSNFEIHLGITFGKTHFRRETIKRACKIWNWNKTHLLWLLVVKYALRNLPEVASCLILKLDKTLECWLSCNFVSKHHQVNKCEYIKTILTWYSVDMNQCTKSPEKKGLTITAVKFGIFVNKQ